jgi:hypothetical protein
MLRAGHLLWADDNPHDAGVHLAWELVMPGTGPPNRAFWATDYLVWVGAAALTYRVSVWYLVVLWEIDRSRDEQARLAVQVAAGR